MLSLPVSRPVRWLCWRQGQGQGQGQGGVAACPWWEHAGSRGGFDGHYGPPGHRRQYDKCIPADGDRRHRFTEVLPREGSWNDGCESCERDVGLREGSHAARRYQFVACGVAEAVVAVGAGSTYRDMALVAAGASRAAAGGPGRGAAVLAARGRW